MQTLPKRDTTSSMNNASVLEIFASQRNEYARMWGSIIWIKHVCKSMK